MAPATATIASECWRDHEAKHVTTKIYTKTEHNKASILQVSFFRSRKFQRNLDYEEAWEVDRYFGAEIAGAQEKHHDKGNDAREGRKSQVLRPSVCPLREGKRNPGIITALIPSLIPKLIAVAETTLTF